jgi:hypothetical protein
MELRGKKASCIQILKNYRGKKPRFFLAKCREIFQQYPTDIKYEKAVKNFYKGLTNKKWSAIIQYGNCVTAVF